ncbi:MAG TPA: sugar ABC transporter substrate-binding protein, partial [Ochrobactrum sp.]|nr:sugar ABC transporter substrate-binding protein [Ochrobactrum sp.]
MLRTILRTGCAIIALTAASNAMAAAVCSKDVRVLAQPRDGLTLLEDYVDDFEELSGVGFE